MRIIEIGSKLLVLGGLSLGLACKIEHTKTVIKEDNGRTATEHSVKLKETISDEEKGVELYKSRDEDDPRVDPGSKEDAP